MTFPTVLICGGAGYIGSHTVWETLKTQKYNVVIFDNFSAGYKQAVDEIGKMYSEFTVSKEGEKPFFEFFKGDILNENDLEACFNKYKIHAIMHFCGLIIVPESVTNPLKYYENNVCGTMKLLKQVEKHAVKYFIFSSTAAIFGNPKKTPIEPEDEKEPINPYGQTKLHVEHILRDCDKAFGLKYVCLRYFNACGADESSRIGEAHKPESHLIPLILQVPLNQRKQITIFGTDYKTNDGTCVRDYVHVTDLATAHIKSLEYLEKPESSSNQFNLGSGEGYSVKEVIEACRRVTNHSIPAVETERRAGDPDILVAGSQKAEKVLGWTRKYKSLEKIVESAWNWHNTHPNGY